MVAVSQSRLSAVSRPSKNNRQGHAQGAERPESQTGRSRENDPADSPSAGSFVEAVEARDLPDGTGLRPLSVEEGRKLREEAVRDTMDDERQARAWYRVVNSWRRWMDDYRSMHIEYEKDGETARTRLENSYQPRYGKRYYAKLKDFERGVSRRWDNLTTAMLTFTASTENAEGHKRCPADHMRDIAEGWRTARKQLHQVLDGVNWEYARVWEPHKSGYGHLHVAVFIDSDHLTAELSPARFKPVMQSYVRECKSAGSKAHTPENAVSVNGDIENLGSYISEYIGAFGEDPLDRSMKEQMFYAVTWATGTRRVDFSNGAHDIIKGEKFRRETGLKPEHRGEAGGTNTSTQSGAESDESGAESEGGEGWKVDSICKVHDGEREFHDPTGGGVRLEPIDGRPGMDPPKRVE